MKQKPVVLLVDDDEMTRDLITFSLQQKGFNVFAESDGLHAVIRLKEQRPDLVILDVMLPDLSGLELLNIMRIEMSMTDIPVILISRLTYPKVISAAHKLGATEYLIKPFKTEQLLEIIAALPGFEVKPASL